MLATEGKSQNEISIKRQNLSEVEEPMTTMKTLVQMACLNSRMMQLAWTPAFRATPTCLRIIPQMITSHYRIWQSC
jgi:hypothetical protein